MSAEVVRAFRVLPLGELDGLFLLTFRVLPLGELDGLFLLTFRVALDTSSQ
ncbi:hypothetical protein ABZY81_32750 [Streptomyces sp. NPDC006514]|uniref:hypothetical protein n=1 Tax=Streptomyces sp. NPDC006514 TaxID=3154308 RepID=UPI0033B92DEC